MVPTLAGSAADDRAEKTCSNKLLTRPLQGNSQKAMAALPVAAKTNLALYTSSPQPALTSPPVLCPDLCNGAPQPCCQPAGCARLSIVSALPAELSTYHRLRRQPREYGAMRQLHYRLYNRQSHQLLRWRQRNRRHFHPSPGELALPRNTGVQPGHQQLDTVNAHYPADWDRELL